MSVLRTIYHSVVAAFIIPTIQYIKDPALNPNENSLWAFGLRVRVAM